MYKVLFCVITASLMVYTVSPSMASQDENLLHTEVLQKYFAQPNKFKKWYGNLHQDDKNLVLAGAVYFCQPDIVDIAIKLGGNVQTNVGSAHGIDEHIFIIHKNENDERGEYSAIGNRDLYNHQLNIATFFDSSHSMLSIGLERCKNPNDGLKISKLLVKNGINNAADTKKFLNKKALIQAKNAEQSKFLIEIGANVNAMLYNRISPLSNAMVKNDFQTVELLLQNGADFNKTNALSNAIRESHNLSLLKKVSLPSLIDAEKGTMLDFVMSYLQKHPLSSEAQAQTFAAVLEIQSDYNKDKAQHKADNKKCDLIKYFIEHGMNINSQDQDGRSALFYAVRKNQPKQEDIKTVKCMLDMGADANLKDKMGQTAFDNCIYPLCNLNPNKALKISPDDENFEQIISNAIHQNDCKTITDLIVNGLDPYTDINGKTLLFRLIEQENQTCLEDVLKTDIDIDLNKKVTIEGRVFTPFTFADETALTREAIPILQQYKAKHPITKPLIGIRVKKQDTVTGEFVEIKTKQNNEDNIFNSNDGVIMDITAD